VGGQVDVVQAARGQLVQHGKAPDVHRRPIGGSHAVLERLGRTALRASGGDPVDRDRAGQQGDQGRGGDDRAPPGPARGARAHGAVAVAGLFVAVGLVHRSPLRVLPGKCASARAVRPPK